jgi:serine/threonine protein kinase
MNHPNIVHVEDIVFTEELIFLIMEYCENGELLSYIQEFYPLQETRVRLFLVQILSALSYIHSHDISHRDLKLENILLDHSLNVKVVDFGFCHQMTKNQLLRTTCGSFYYSPPEILQNHPYDGKKRDMWSIGVILFIMTSGTYPWTAMNQAKLVSQINRADFEIPISVSDNFRTLILALMSVDPKIRPGPDEILTLPWLQNFQKKLFEPNQRSRLRAHSFATPSRPISRRNVPFGKRSVIIRPLLPRTHSCPIERSFFQAKPSNIDQFVNSS